MKLTNQFTVAAPLERTWVALLDLRRMAQCLPGATIEPDAEGGTYRGTVQVKLGPMRLVYTGTVRLTDIDELGHQATMEVAAKELRGPGTATARVRNALTEAGHRQTIVAVETDLDITGRAAQLGRGIIESVAQTLLSEFAAELQVQLEAADVEADGSEAVTESARGAQPDLRRDRETLDLGRRLWRPLSVRAGVAVAVACLIALLARSRKYRR
jgi:carbon monoxide dehydrogenase subunit G